MPPPSGPGLYVLVGSPCSGKSTYAHRNFKPSQIVSYDDVCRSIGDGEVECENATKKLVWDLIEIRCSMARRTCVDSTNLTPESRARYRTLARDYNLPCYAVVFCTDLNTLIERNSARAIPHPEDVIERCWLKQDRACAVIATEGFTGYWFA